jgi:PGAP1-like protein
MELTIRWTVGGLLILVAIWLCTMNAIVFWQHYVRRVHTPSWIPLVGGFLGMFGLLVVPVDLANRLCGLPLLLDCGTLPGLAITFVFHLQRLARRRDGRLHNILSAFSAYLRMLDRLISDLRNLLSDFPARFFDAPAGPRIDNAPRVNAEGAKRLAPRKVMRVAVYAFMVMVLAGCAQPVNPSFPVSDEEARAALAQMERDRRALDRPVVVISGFADPGFALPYASDRIRSFSRHAKIIPVCIGFCGSFEECRNRVIDAVERACPSGDPYWTVQVDVVGISLGGVVARYAAAPHDFSDHFRRLNIARLFTISSPHKGATAADDWAMTDFECDIKTGSKLMKWLARYDAQARYQLFPYVHLGDEIVGEQNAAPPGRNPLWLSNPPLVPPHVGAQIDDRIWADIARRLRGEPPFSHLPPAPIPQ